MLDEFGIKIFWLVIATVFGWVAHELSRYYFLQRTISAYLLIVIPSLIKESRVSLDQMESYFANKVDVGKAINIAPTYSNDGRLDLIACVKVEVIKILSRDEVKKIYTFLYCTL